MVLLFALGLAAPISADVTNNPVAATILIAVNLMSTEPANNALVNQTEASGNFQSCYSSFNTDSQAATEDSEAERAIELSLSLCQTQASLYSWQRSGDQMLVLVEPI